MGTYHLRRKDRAIEDPEEMKAILRKGRYAVVALCRGDEPYVVTLNHGFDATLQCLYFHAAPQGHKLDFVHANPQACATVIDDRGYVMGDCSHKFRSVVVRGAMTVVRDDAEKAHAMDLLIRHQESDPEPLVRRFLDNSAWTAGVAMLRLDIREMTGKASL